ncbi:hypothetical protein [Streptomyces sp. SP17KL33]|uniref:hypothetical protein n=1 Tax=Streptomyces sp. SP17KL33 TaxID=3002534 RepID=UPI002E768F5F|nr:hypothetical protein [Streptomyces sp. SP17KL33]MEE1838071.1 hypothetical protein [Streptomyces sp. SP17KL33]
MNQIDLKAEIAELRRLGHDFEDLRDQVRSPALPPGTATRERLTAHIVAANELAHRTLKRLAALDNSPYAAVPGGRPALELLAAAVCAATTAASDLACALVANPLQTAPFLGPPADEATLQAARLKEANPRMAKHLADAAEQLELGHTSCRYTAAGITRGLKRHAEQHQDQPAPPVKITDRQYAVLVRLSAGGGTLHEVGRSGVIKAVDKDRSAVSMATLNSLIKHRLVGVDTTTSLCAGQRLLVTTDGTRTLAAYKPPAPAPTQTTALTPPSTQRATGRTR